ncbi:FAD:protein FMN transferase [Aestuariibius sp. 2305UL40-4]|uniref:FAD:protein FMN transferase n=1 Tax=Aestuariibius violaceus TaxID=3234132 RepID=UPI00345EC24A
MNRRRFLMISAAMAATPALASRERWTGRALGAEAQITLEAPPDVADKALAAARATLAEIEGLFTLHAPSALTELNANGRLRMNPAFADLVQAADHAHHLTGGLFDPTVQPLWRALAEGRDPGPASALIGWERVIHDNLAITLDAGQALTFNGIAQGYATEAVRRTLTAHGLTRALIHVGEYAAISGPYRLGLSDPAHGLVATRTLTGGAIATSSPAATPLAGGGHILHQTARPRWSTVSVEGPDATLADALSTALCLADLDSVREIRARAGDAISRITLIDADGNIRTL